MTLNIDSTSYKSPNYNERPHNEVSSVVFHDGEGSKQSDLSRLTNDKVPEDERVSAHYYVDRAGHIYRLVEDKWRAWHAGESSYLGRTNWNDFAIGVETEHKKGQNWPVVQVQAIRDLFIYLIELHGIKQEYMVAHKWIAPGRKPDPTDWSNDDLHAFFASLYGPAYAIQGLTTPMSCGKGFYDFYNIHGALGMFGFALTVETADIDILNRPCTWMRFERCVFKYVEGEGVHLALSSEALVKKWIT